MSRLDVLSGFVLILFIPATIAVVEFNCSVIETIIYILTCIVTPFTLGLYYTEVFSFIRSAVVGLYTRFLYFIDNLGRW
jgi:putative effector of murein hydrolase LrgA (UPF0299 family)